MKPRTLLLAAGLFVAVAMPRAAMAQGGGRSGGMFMGHSDNPNGPTVSPYMQLLNTTASRATRPVPVAGQAANRPTRRARSAGQLDLPVGAASECGGVFGRGGGRGTGHVTMFRTTRTRSTAATAVIAWISLFAVGAVLAPTETALGSADKPLTFWVDTENESCSARWPIDADLANVLWQRIVTGASLTIPSMPAATSGFGHRLGGRGRTAIIPELILFFDRHLAQPVEMKDTASFDPERHALRIDVEGGHDAKALMAEAFVARRGAAQVTGADHGHRRVAMVPGIPRIALIISSQP